MSLQPTRRTVLRAGGVFATSALAGCSVLPGVGSSPGDPDDPDQGKQSFGVRVVNETDHTYPVTVTAWPRGESDDVFFEERAEVTPDDPHEWDQVLTGEGLFVVEATVDDDHFVVADAENRRTVVVGMEHSPSVKNVRVELLEELESVVADVDMGWKNR
jgi:hypothetical protein